MEQHKQSPIVVAGVGGSGTRVVAECLNQLGVFIGHDINVANDEQWFLLLLRRPLWFRSVYQDNPDEIAKFIKLHRDLMIDQNLLTNAHWADIREARAYFLSHNYLFNLHWHFGKKWVRQRILTLENRTPVKLNDYTSWGWKSPIAHIYLPELKKQYPNMRYIHLIRSGLDMAYSSNQKQAKCWSWLFDLSFRRRHQPKASLEYWVRSNQRAIKFCQDELATQHLIIHFEDLCKYPKREIERIASFIGISVTPEKLSQLALIPRAPKSIGRYQKHGVKDFGEDLLYEVAQLGYEATPITSSTATYRSPLSRAKYVPRFAYRKLKNIYRIMRL